MALERLTHLQSVELVQAAHCSGHVTDFETLEAERFEDRDLELRSLT